MNDKISDKPVKTRMQKNNYLKYNISGSDSQSLQIILDPKQYIICKESSILYFEEGIEIKYKTNNSDAKKTGIMSKIFDASKAVIKGEKIFVNIVINNSHSPRKISLAAPTNGKIQALNIDSPNGEYFTIEDSFLCASSQVHMGVSNSEESGSTIFRLNERLTKLEGRGLAFISADGGFERHELDGSSSVLADPNAVLARSASVDLRTKKIMRQGKSYIKSLLSGRGVIYIQTHPTNKLINKIMPTIISILQKSQRNK